MKRRHSITLQQIRKSLFMVSWLSCSLLTSVNGQISYGGKPLKADAEKFSAIHSMVDYTISMPAVDNDSLIALNSNPGNRIGGLKFAQQFTTDLTPENSGIVFYTTDSTRVWKVGIRSKGAYSLNVIFSDFLLPEGAAVYVYNADRSSIRGAFTNRNRPDGGTFSLSPIDGDELVVEYHEPANAPFSGKIRISAVNHDYLGLFRTGTRFNQLNLPCLPDVSCNPDLEEIARSVCLLIINGSYYGSGVLVNNTTNNGEPYLLTSAHVLQNKASYGSTVVAFLNYRSPRCTDFIRGSEEFSISGCETKAMSTEIDFALLKLNALPPADYRPFLAGWTTDSSNLLNPYTGIHHPYGEVQKYCIEQDSIQASSWPDTTTGIRPDNHWLVTRWDTGHTWSGSSGSPLFNKDFRVCGNLTGGNSGGVLGCDTVYYGDLYYRFDKAWDHYPDSAKQLKYWLDPVGVSPSSGSISADGLDPYRDNPAQRLTNLSETDSVGIIWTTPPQQGSLVGQNSYGYTQYAEHYTTSDSVMLQGVFFMAAAGTYDEDSPVTIRVFSGGSSPGVTLVKEVLHPVYRGFTSGRYTTISKTTFKNAENYFRLNSPVSVGTDFYISYECPRIKTATDSFYVYAAIRKFGTFNSAWYKNDSIWRPLVYHTDKNTFTSLWIEPVVQRDTITTPADTIIEEENNSTTLPILYYSKINAELNIIFPADWTDETTLYLYELSGMRIKTFTLQPTTQQIPCKLLPNRFYLCRLKTAKKQVVFKLLTGD